MSYARVDMTYTRVETIHTRVDGWIDRVQGFGNMIFCITWDFLNLWISEPRHCLGETLYLCILIKEKG